MVKSYRGLTAFAMIQMIFLIASCNEGVECGDFHDKFGIIGFNINEYHYEDESNFFLASALNSDDSVSYDSLFLHLNASIQTFSYNFKGSLVSSAYACSPLAPSPIDTVASIEIFKQEQTGPVNFNLGVELSADFDIVSFTETDGFSARIPLSEFNASDHPASSSYFLFLNRQPENSQRITYRIKVTFIDGDVMQASSAPIVITP